MTVEDQKLSTMPKELFVQFESVRYPVRPNMEFFNKRAKYIPLAAEENGFRQLYTNDIVSVYKELKEGAKDGYVSLAEKQPLVEANKLTKNRMLEILRTFSDQILKEHNVIWAEILDWTPEKRLGYKLTDDKEVLYRNWDLSDKEVQVQNADLVTVSWPTEYVTNGLPPSEEMIEKLGVPENTRVWANKKYAIGKCDGLNIVRWGFAFQSYPCLFSIGDPQSYQYVGTILGIDTNKDLLIENFDSSKN